MKISRYKRTQRILSFYRNNFALAPPYSVLIDGTFCKAALDTKINIREQLPGYLSGPVKLCTTKCVLSELEVLGPAFYGPKLVASQFFCIRCTHDPVSASDCIKRLLIEGSKHDQDSDQKKLYFVATLDPGLGDAGRSIPGVPVLFIKYNSILLEKPSEADTVTADSACQSRLNYEGVQKENLTALKTSVLGVGGDPNSEKKKHRRKKKGGPNPLSCKKKKKVKVKGPPRESRKKSRQRHRKKGDAEGGAAKD